MQQEQALQGKAIMARIPLIQLAAAVAVEHLPQVHLEVQASAVQAVTVRLRQLQAHQLPAAVVVEHQVKVVTAQAVQAVAVLVEIMAALREQQILVAVVVDVIALATAVTAALEL
jgi:hypothetical protein